MKGRLKFVLSMVMLVLILVLIFCFILPKEQYFIEESNLFKTYYYPNKTLQVMEVGDNEEEFTKIIVKNTTQESYLYQIRVDGLLENDIYIKYKKENGKLSDEIYLKNLGNDKIIIENQHMTPSQEDTYLFYAYSKSSQETSNLFFIVEEVTISQDNLEDITPPTIILNGENELTIYQNEEFFDLGIQSISDNYDENISFDKVKKTYQLEQNGNLKVVEKIDTSIIGTYYIHYSVSDLAKNETNVIRILHILEKKVEEKTDEDFNQKPEEVPIKFQTEVFYSNKNMTTKPVTVTIMANEPLIAIDGWELSRDELKLTKIFASNVTQDILVTSKSGKSVITKILIQNIDKSEWNTDGTLDIPVVEEEITVKLNTKEYGTNYIKLEFTVSNDKNIKEYSYTCDGNNWMIAKSKTITCENLLQNTTYNVQVKVLTKKDVIYYSNTVTKTTMSLSNPVFDIKNETEWSKTKEVTITYPQQVTGVDYYYKIDSEWIKVSTNTITIEVLKNQIIYAKVTDQTNTVEVSREVSHIDREGPTLTNKTLSTSILRSNKIKLNWQKVSDVSTTEQELIYYVCKNKEEFVCRQTPDAKLTNINTYTFSSLNPNTTYKIQILVEDKLGNYSSYDNLEFKTKELYDISDKKDLVAIMYSTWFNPIYKVGNNNPPNISNILAGLESWGSTNQFHYWAKPALGYYRSDDKAVIRKHMIQLEEAGVDFIILDNTNANYNAWGYGEGSYWHNMVTLPLKALTETIREMRDEGYETPYIVNWIGTNDGWITTNQIYQDFYTKEDNQDLFVYWNNKPFILTTSTISNPQVGIYTRKMWGLQTTLGTQEWSYLQVNNDKPSYSKDGIIEQIGVSVAMQRTYMSNTATAVGRNHGITFYNQWKTAFKYHPKVVTITWWNEWAAQRLYVNNTYVFTDNYNQEYSRDIEPMEGGHGDQYYKWLKQYIKAYKEHNSCPRLVESGY